MNVIDIEQLDRLEATGRWESCTVGSRTKDRACDFRQEHVGRFSRFGQYRHCLLLEKAKKRKSEKAIKTVMLNRG